jgi:short-subunit dehydrogenase involved in D-alanine esterification of teichoic acids
MSSFVENVSVVREQLKNNLSDVAGFTGRGEQKKSFTLGDILDSVEKLGTEYPNLTTMFNQTGISQQNKSWVGIRTVLESLGTPVESQVQKTTRSPMSGTNAVMEMLKARNLTMPVKS